jgi:hypothetical protein
MLTKILDLNATNKRFAFVSIDLTLGVIVA